jgi:hypothetical protein
MFCALEVRAHVRGRTPQMSRTSSQLRSEGWRIARDILLAIVRRIRRQRSDHDGRGIKVSSHEGYSAQKRYSKRVDRTVANAKTAFLCVAVRDKTLTSISPHKYHLSANAEQSILIAAYRVLFGEKIHEKTRFSHRRGFRS